MKKRAIAICDYSYHDVTSGGDVIAAEFGLSWKKAGHTVTLYTHPEAKAFFRTRGLLPNALHTEGGIIRTNFHSVLAASIAHTLYGIIAACRSDSSLDIIFAASCMFEDLLPALIRKIKHPRAKLVVSIYLFPQPPWTGAYGSTLLHRYIFWIMFHVGIFLSRMAAYMIWTACEPDAQQVRTTLGKRATAIRGGIDPTAAANADAYRMPRIDALSLGRFHPQKNLLELLDIWKLVNRKLPHATLVLAGEGFLKTALQEKIEHLNLTETVTIEPAIDGPKKFDLYASSNIFVSASHYDTGNLALDEALACGTPGIIYDTPKLTYPAGVVRVPLFDQHQFANSILELLENPHKRTILAKQARGYTATLAWDTQAAKALKSIIDAN